MKGSRFWWISYTSNGKRHCESSESEKRSVAQTRLNDRLGDIGKGIEVTPKLNKKTLGEGLQSVIDDQEMNDRASVDHTRRRIKLHLLKHLHADRRMSAITTADLTAYVITRRAEGRVACVVQSRARDHQARVLARDRSGVS